MITKPNSGTLILRHRNFNYDISKLKRIIAMLDFNVLRLAILISNGYKYFLFIENSEGNVRNPLIITVKVVPFQKLHDANSVKSMYGEYAFLIKTMVECELLFDIAEGFNGIKYVVNDMIEFPKLEIKKALNLVN